MKYILASQSPRRRQLLKQIIDEFDVVPSDADETLPDGILPKDAVIMLAIKKAEAVASDFPDDVVIAADTIVVHDGAILGKPADEADAKRMLTLLSNDVHYVITGVCVIHNNLQYSFAQSTTVEFDSISDEQIDEYVATGEPMDKAGAYAIQGGAGKFVKRINGDLNNVIGLPVDGLKSALINMGLL